MKRSVIWLAIIVILSAGAVWIFGQRWIGERVFDNAVAQRVGVDRTAELPDGLHVFVCGSGSPMPDANRAGPCIAVLAGRDGYIFDVGSGSDRKLGAMGFPMDRLQGTFLTHLHSDHFDGLGALMLQAWMAGGRDEPLPVYGPEGTDRLVDGLMQAYEIDRGYRIAHHGPEVARPTGFGGIATNIEENFTFERNGLSIRTLRVDHAPIDNAFAFRLDYEGRSVVISGDLKYSEEFARFSQDADVILHEALNPTMVGQLGETLAARGNTDGAKIMADIPDYHTSPEDAARVAQLAGAKALVLYHLVPAPPVRLIEPALLGDAEKHFDGRLELAEDGMLISLPAESQQVEIDQLL
ncbi:MBL fold metallo-hydrolase [Altererythrobacter ishigakiensis]|uniref:Ribonuclease Z n=1 Tax=Altererythrobacter ishigakiensis TaxID=476157 RepID=A0A562UW84_9SPHN|nr:MBL fold metallo-hydrolase [Altererythrobacter ishigakiensis]TWJ09892.1 ribonuclease Z [Altererythrobacter ishigakiensis]